MIRKRTVALAGVLAMMLGFLMGSAFPGEELPWGVDKNIVNAVPGEVQQPVVSVIAPADSSTSGENAPAQSTADNKGKKAEPINPKENFPLLNTACSALRAIQQRDYSALAAHVHPDRGLTFTPYSTVDVNSDLNFNPSQVKKFAGDTNRYVWGAIPGAGELIQMTPEDFISKYIFGSDYTQASKIGIDKINISGNALENVAEAYPDCRFVEFTFPGTEAGGQNWSSLKLVLAPVETQWYLVALIHSQWTV